MPGLRSQDLVFTLYGDHLLPRRAPVSVGSLITLLGRLGVSPAAVRTVLSRMIRKGWLAVERRGARSYYGLTARGRRLLEEGRERIYHPPRDERWDGSWYLVSYSIPENRRRLRDRLRIRLLWLGCGPLTNGLWISPHDIRPQVREIATSLGIARHVEIFHSRHLGFSDRRRLVSECWDLRAVNARYAAFIAKYEPRYERDRAPLRREGGLPPAACFVHRFRLVHEYRTFPLLDPYLPRSLLPRGWLGDRAAQLFEAYHDLLAGPAERYVDSVCEFAPGTAVPARARREAALRVDRRKRHG